MPHSPIKLLAIGLSFWWLLPWSWADHFVKRWTLGKV